uniref:Uncharacterized protein n=1 Tax=Romanomermis culicivorax TaxID=13658 RepID=A0A915K269_ROMCU
MMCDRDERGIISSCTPGAQHLYQSIKPRQCDDVLMFPISYIAPLTSLKAKKLTRNQSFFVNCV